LGMGGALGSAGPREGRLEFFSDDVDFAPHVNCASSGSVFQVSVNRPLSSRVDVLKTRVQQRREPTLMHLGTPHPPGHGEFCLGTQLQIRNRPPQADWKNQLAARRDAGPSKT